MKISNEYVDYNCLVNNGYERGQEEAIIVVNKSVVRYFLTGLTNTLIDSIW